MHNNLPLVSVLILTMNHERFIQQACASAFGADLSNLEIILLDNLSEDKTFQLAKECLSDTHRKTSLPKCRTVGCCQKSQFLVVQGFGEIHWDSFGDDWWDEKMIAEKVKFLEESNCDFALSDGYKFIQETAETV